jgi:receptor protein-tyrosine kinase
VLVDLDSTEPALRTQGDDPVPRGVCEVLRGESALLDALRDAPPDAPWQLALGRWDEQAQALLMQGKIREVFDELRASFDFVIVNGSPLQPTGDTAFVDRYADAAILSVMREVSQASEVLTARENLEALGIQTLGAVVVEPFRTATGNRIAARLRSIWTVARP